MYTPTPPHSQRDQVDKILDVEANLVDGAYKVNQPQSGVAQRHKLWINKKHFTKGKLALWRPNDGTECQPNVDVCA